jgi:hypothetical protein
MSPFILSLKRLYDANRLTMTKLDDLLTAGKVSQEEYEYIIK